MTGISKTLEASIMNMKVPSPERILAIFSNSTSTPAASYLVDVDTINPTTQMNSTKDDSTTSQDATTTGFTHGFLTAQIFALNNMSRLGFIHQYIDDTLTVMDVDTQETFAESYRASFVRGLRDAENLVDDAIHM
jgi:hypothetical protein